MADVNTAPQLLVAGVPAQINELSVFLLQSSYERGLCLRVEHSIRGTLIRQNQGVSPHLLRTMVDSYDFRCIYDRFDLFQMARLLHALLQ